VYTVNQKNPEHQTFVFNFASANWFSKFLLW